MELNFKEGDDVILYYGRGSRHMKRTKVKSVYKTNNFILEDFDGQFRQSGFEATRSSFATSWVEHSNEYNSKKLVRYKRELAATIGIEKVREALKEIPDENLDLITKTCLGVIRNLRNEEKSE